MASCRIVKVDGQLKKRYYLLNQRMWRNWQTRRLQEPVGIALVEVRFLSSAVIPTVQAAFNRPGYDLTLGGSQADKLGVSRYSFRSELYRRFFLVLTSEL
jgi:hypothetical protein